MGVIKRGILGGISGKVANVVGGSWKGIAYLRALPLSVANPQTAGQVGQRTKFATALVIAQAILAGIIKPLNDRFVSGMSGCNAFVSRAIPFISSVGVVTWASIQTSVGSLLGFSGLTLVGSAATNVATIDWVNNSGTGNALATDITYFAVYNETQDVWGVSAAGTTRNAPDDTIAFTDLVLNDVLHLYASLLAANGSKVSTSDYVTANCGA